MLTLTSCLVGWNLGGKKLKGNKLERKEILSMFRLIEKKRRKKIKKEKNTGSQCNSFPVPFEEIGQKLSNFQLLPPHAERERENAPCQWEKKNTNFITLRLKL